MTTSKWIEFPYLFSLLTHELLVHILQYLATSLGMHALSHKDDSPSPLNVVCPLIFGIFHTLLIIHLWNTISIYQELTWFFLVIQITHSQNWECTAYSLAKEPPLPISSPSSTMHVCKIKSARVLTYLFNMFSQMLQ